MVMYRLLEEERLRRLRQQLGMAEPTKQNAFADYVPPDVTARPQPATESITPLSLQAARELARQEFAKNLAREQAPVAPGPGLVGGLGNIAAAYDELAKSVAAGGTLGVQKLIPGQQGLENAFRAYVGAGEYPSNALLRAWQESNFPSGRVPSELISGILGSIPGLGPLGKLAYEAAGAPRPPVGVKGAIELGLDPINLAFAAGPAVRGGTAVLRAGAPLVRAAPGAVKGYVRAAARGPEAQAVVPVKQATTAGRVAKEPWQMTFEKFVQAESGRGKGAFATEGRNVARDHELLVARALYEGKSVPPEVLAEYPGIATLSKARLGAVLKAKPLAAGQAELPVGATKPARTAKEIDEALGRFEATRPGDVPKPAIETEAQYVSRRIKEQKADAQSIGFALDETKQRATLRQEYRAAASVAKAPSTAVPARGRATEAVAPKYTAEEWAKFTPAQRAAKQRAFVFARPKAAKAAGVTEGVAAWETGAPRPFAFDPNSTVNQGRFRLLPPVTEKGRYITRQSTTPGVSYIMDTKANAIQSVRFNKGTFTEAQAAQWWEANKARLQPSAAGQGLPPPATAAPTRAGPLVGQQAAPGAPAAALPSGRVPGGPRAQPLPPRQPPPPTQPPAPPTGALPSGRRPGGPQNVRPAQPVDNYQRVVEALTPERDPLIKRVWNSLPRLWYDRNYPFKAISEQTGVPVRQLAQTVPGSGAAAENIVRKFYAPVRNTVGADEKRLLEYLVLRRNDDILARNPSALLPGGVRGSAGNIQALKTLEQKLGPERLAKVEAAAKEVWRLNDEMVLQPMVAWEKGDPQLARLLDMGIRPEPIISKELYRQLRTSHPHYVSFKRADFTDFLDEIETSFGRPEVNVASMGLKRMDLAGSERKLSLTFEALLSDVYRTQALLARNRAAKSLGDALIEAQRLTGDEVIRFIEPSPTLATAQRVTGAPPLPVGRAGVPPAKLDGRLSFYHNGEKYVAEVSREFEAAAKGLYAEPDNLILSTLRALAQPLRRGATEFDPFFLPMNIIRDSMSALFREKMIPFGPDHLTGLWGAIRKNALFEQAANDGALISGFVETGRGMGMRTRSALGALNIRTAGDALLAIPRAISEANVIFERGTRVGVYRKLSREAPNANRVVPKTVFSQFTADDLDRISKAVRSRDATVDFSKAGTAMRTVNQVVPFLNPATQGTANIIRTMRDHPARFLAFAAGFSGVAALARLNNMRFETSDLIPDYEYIRYWVVQFGEGTRKDGTKFPMYLRIPKGEFVAATTFPIEAIFHTARANEDRSAVELLLDAGISATEAVSPLDVRQGVFGVLPPLAGTAGGLQLDVDPFTQQPIIPRKEQQRLPEQQFGAETSSAAIALGQKFGISPRKIDFAIKDYTAGAGKTVLWLMDMALEILGYKPEVFGAEVEAPMEGAEALSRTPLGRVFGTRATQEERRGWEQFNAAVEDSNRQFSAIPGMNSLGVKLGAVGDSIDVTPGRAGGSVELTPDQRAGYQQHMARQVIPHMERIMPNLVGITDAEQKRKLAMKAMDGAKDAARASFIPILRRLQAQQAQQKSAAPAQPSAPSGAAASDRLRQLREELGIPEPVGAR